MVRRGDVDTIRTEGWPGRVGRRVQLSKTRKPNTPASTMLSHHCHVVIRLCRRNLPSHKVLDRLRLLGVQLGQPREPLGVNLQLFQAADGVSSSTINSRARITCWRDECIQSSLYPLGSGSAVVGLV